MNTFFVLLFSVLAVAHAGIYSARWSAAGRVPGKVILRSDQSDQRGIDSSQYLFTPGSAPSTKLENFGDKTLFFPETPLEESNNRIKDVTLEIPSSSHLQRSDQIGLQDIDSSQYVSIGSVNNESPSTQSEEQSQYKPKRVRSVTLVSESESNSQNKNFESPEAPASTVRTPSQAYYPAQPSNIYQTSNFGYPAVPAHNYGPSGYPGHLDHHQSTLRPINNLPVYQGTVVKPTHQSAVSIAQNSPGFQFSSASANSNNPNGIGSSAISIAQNHGGLQSTLSVANSNGQGSAVSAAQNNKYQASSVAQTLNQNANGANSAANSVSLPHFQTAVAYNNNNRVKY